MLLVALAAEAAPLSWTNAVVPGTVPLELQGDIASNLVAGVDRFLLREIKESPAGRSSFWIPDRSSPQPWVRPAETNRLLLAKMIGARDAIHRRNAPQVQMVLGGEERLAAGATFDVVEIRWGAFGDVEGCGLVLIPNSGQIIADVIAVPDADVSPEQLCGLVPGVPPESQFARRLAESGCRVYVPLLIDRTRTQRRHAKLTHREFLYRPAFEMGRHILGYEVLKVLALVDWLRAGDTGRRPLGLLGHGEGGFVALLAGALETRVDVVGVSGFFEDRSIGWKQPIDRNVFGYLRIFGDAEVARLIAPRTFLVEAALGPELTLPGNGGAPAVLTTPDVAAVRKEFSRMQKIVAEIPTPNPAQLIVSGVDGRGAYGSEAMLATFLKSLVPNREVAASGKPPKLIRPLTDGAQRMAGQIRQLDRHTQELLELGGDLRRDYMKRLDFTSTEAYRKSTEVYRSQFSREVIGQIDQPRLPFNAHSKKAYDSARWSGFEVTLDVFPDVMAYGVLLVPKDLQQGERRPVVVCQHGLEGRPKDVIQGDQGAYHDFAARLADRGFIVFAPQNLYIFEDRFRTLQRKANQVGQTLFSVITPQHQQILDWLKTLECVDASRLAFYGLSYGGKTAMRVPALLTDYCLSICSADFNDWVWKNTSTVSNYSYVWSGEYEIFEFDLGSTFNYAEMAALIAPRPFMVERGHFDGVAPDERVFAEFGKVRYLYAGKLGLPNHSRLESFAGPHTINGKGTFDFLHEHLNWPNPTLPQK